MDINSIVKWIPIKMVRQSGNNFYMASYLTYHLACTKEWVCILHEPWFENIKADVFYLPVHPIRKYKADCISTFICFTEQRRVGSSRISNILSSQIQYQSHCLTFLIYRGSPGSVIMNHTYLSSMAKTTK